VKNFNAIPNNQTADFLRRDGRTTHFDWADGRNYIRGDTIQDGNLTVNGKLSVTGSRQCRDTSTQWNDEGNGNAIYLDRHNIVCGDDENITRMQLTRNHKGKYRYNYRCCKY
jgi:hypothetical protein